MEEDEENLRRKQGQDKENDCPRECGGDVRKGERKRQKNWRSRKQNRQTAKVTATTHGVYEVQVKMKSSQEHDE